MDCGFVGLQIHLGSGGGLQILTNGSRLEYVQRGGKLERPTGSSENEKTFLEKPISKKTAKRLKKKGLTVREINKDVVFLLKQ